MLASENALIKDYCALCAVNSMNG
ncbi:uncharacterized protein METZ01_LOCUS504936, partial [marine metagenome]